MDLTVAAPHLRAHDAPTYSDVIAFCDAEIDRLYDLLAYWWEDYALTYPGPDGKRHYRTSSVVEQASRELGAFRAFRRQVQRLQTIQP